MILTTFVRKISSVDETTFAGFYSSRGTRNKMNRFDAASSSFSPHPSQIFERLSLDDRGDRQSSDVDRF